MQKDKSTKWLYIIGLFFVVACNKNSTELPPIITTPKTFSVGGTFNYDSIIKVLFVQSNLANQDSVAILITNPADSPLTGLRVIVEFCNDTPQNFDNCYPVWDTTLPKLSGRATTAVHNLYLSKNFPLSRNNMHVYIVACDRINTNALHGYYSLGYASFEKRGIPNPYSLGNEALQLSKATSGKHYFLGCRAYIQPDGFATFRLKDTGKLQYNIFWGKFTDTTSFSGNVTNGAQFLSPVTLKSTAKLTIQGVNLNLSILNPFTSDTSTTISFNLNRN